MGPLCLNISHFGLLLWRRDIGPVAPRPILAYHHGRHVWATFPGVHRCAPCALPDAHAEHLPLFRCNMWCPRFLQTTNKELPQWSTLCVCPRFGLQIGFVVGAGAGAPAPVPRIETLSVSVLFPFPSFHGDVCHKQVWVCAKSMWHHSGLQQCKLSFVTGDFGSPTADSPIGKFPGFKFVAFERFIEKNFGTIDLQILDSKLFNFVCVMSPRTSLLDL